METMLTETIIHGWDATPRDGALCIADLKNVGYESWTIRIGSEYGVALPVENNEEISEYFAGAHYYTKKITLAESDERDVVLLTTQKDDIKEQFASLCAELLNPGKDGELRKDIAENPLIWWMQWKELLGNKNVDLRAYDVLGELWTLKYLAEHSEHAEWNGPNGATYDIDCDGYYVEVKATLARKKRQITLNNMFQLDPPDGSKLYLILCQFEPSQAGFSINSLVSDLEQLGYSSIGLNDKLQKLGLEKGKTARKRCYMLHAAIRYVVDDSFPAIRESSFVGGVKPAGVESITYTVSLDGIIGENIKKDNE